jgi:hypothetical protein
VILLDFRMNLYDSRMSLIQDYRVSLEASSVNLSYVRVNL